MYIYIYIIFLQLVVLSLCLVRVYEFNLNCIIISSENSSLVEFQAQCLRCFGESQHHLRILSEKWKSPNACKLPGLWELSMFSEVQRQFLLCAFLESDLR